MLNMTYLGLNLSHYINGVAKKHGEVARHMFAFYVIDSITNGVHVGTWAAPTFQTLFACYIPGWHEDNFSLRYALSLPRQEVWEAHMASKRTLLDYVNRTTNVGMEADVFTLDFARHALQARRPAILGP